MLVGTTLFVIFIKFLIMGFDALKFVVCPLWLYCRMWSHVELLV